MNLENFPNCCGIKVFTGFPLKSVYLSNKDVAAAVKEAKNFIKNEIEDQKKDASYGPDVSTADGILMAVLNNNQLEVCGSMLKSLGFKRLQTATNPKHGSILNVFSYTVKRTSPGQKIKY